MPDNLQVIDRWRPLEHGSRDTGATVVCPSCGRDFMVNNRTIDAKGIVFGRVKCPWNRRNNPQLKAQMDRDEADDCDFEAEIRLEGWPPSGPLTQPG